MEAAQPPQHLDTPIKPSSVTGPTSMAGNLQAEASKPDGGKAPSERGSKNGLTFANQDALPKLPVPNLEDTCRRYLESLSPLQSPREQAESKAAVEEFLKTDGPVLQEKLKNYASSTTSYIEQFCMYSMCCWLELSLTPSRV